MDVKIEQSWKERLAPEFEKDYFKELINFVKQEYSHGTVYPPGPYIFNAFEHCPFDKVKVSSRSDKGCHFRARPLPWSRTGTRALFLCSGRDSLSSIPDQHL